MNSNNKIDVKSTALAGQRVIKVTQNGEDIFLPVGLSSMNPNGGDGGGSIEFYECASVESGRVFTGIKITGSTGQDGIYFLEDESATGADRIYKSDNGYNFQYEDMGAIGYRWVLVETGTTNFFATCTLSTSADLTVEEICNNLSWDAYYDTYPVAEVYTAAGDASWSGYKMTWSDGEAGWVKADTPTEGLTVKGYTPDIGKVYTKDTTAVVTLYPDGTADFDFSDATAFTSAQLLSGQKGWDSSGNLVAGTMTNHGSVTVTLSDQAQTLDRGFYNSITIPAGFTFELPEGEDTPEYFYSEQAKLDGTAGALVDFRFKDELIKTITTVADAEYIYPADNASIMGTENYIHIPDITKLTADVLKKGETILGVKGTYEGTTTSNVTFGYIKNGSFQAVNLTGNAPTDTGSAVEIDAVTFHTGQNVPDYGDAGGGSSIEFYECATYTPDADAYTKYSFTMSGAPDTDANSTYERTKWVETPDPDSNYTTAQWTAANGYTIIEESGWGEFRYYIKNASGTNVYGTDTPLYSRATDYSTIPWMDMDMYESVTLTFSAIQTEEVPATTEGWTGYKMEKNTDGEWVKSSVLTENLQVAGYVPSVGRVYNIDTTIAASLFVDFFIQPFNVEASSYQGSQGSAVTYNYQSGAIGYCSAARGDWAVYEGGIFSLPLSTYDYEKYRIAGDNGATNWYFAWSNNSEVIIKGFQCSTGYEKTHGTTEFLLQGASENSDDESSWTTIASYTADSSNYDKVNYYSVANNNTAYRWYRILVTNCNTHPYLGYLSAFLSDIGEVYYGE